MQQRYYPDESNERVYCNCSKMCLLTRLYPSNCEALFYGRRAAAGTRRYECSDAPVTN
jgi:hypothetical protein